MSTLESQFQSAWGGAFLSRDGAGKVPGVPASQKKLCFTATDKAFLLRFLFDLSERPGCHSVKLSVAPRAGMYLGRCFALDDHTAGQWWSEFKTHDQLMCNLQDDAFIAEFRDWEAINAQRAALASDAIAAELPPRDA